MRHFLLSILLLAGTLLSAEVRAQAPTPQSRHWKVAEDRLVFGPARISLPRRVGTAEFSESRDMGAAEEGLDSAVLFRTADQEVLATLYLYMPSIAHPAIQRISTGRAIELSSNGTARLVREGSTSVAAIPDAVLTTDHEKYLQGFATKSAFLKAGRWLIKIRVSGSPLREPELSAIRSALILSLRFEGEAQPRAVPPLSLSECPPSSGPDARLLPKDDHALEVAITAALDPLGDRVGPKGGSKPLESRIGTRWCLSDLEAGSSRIPLLRSLETGAGSLGERSQLLALYSDAGGILEVVKRDSGKTYVALRHGIGGVEVLGAFDSVPSDGQMRRLLTRTGEEGRVRAGVRLKANGDSEVTVVAPKRD